MTQAAMIQGHKAIAAYLSDKTGLDLSPERIRTWVSRGKLPVRRLPGRIVFQAAAELDAWLERGQRDGGWSCGWNGKSCERQAA